MTIDSKDTGNPCGRIHSYPHLFVLERPVDFVIISSTEIHHYMLYAVNNAHARVHANVQTHHHYHQYHHCHVNEREQEDYSSHALSRG